jgi:hypothetical protein
MATTTNYGWTTPDDTALVKDGASAIRTLGSSVDTTTKNLNPSTTLGDIEYRSSTANTNTRLAIGSTGQVLTVAGGVPTWATATAPASGLTLITRSTFSSAATVDIDSIFSSTYIYYKVLVERITGASSSASLQMQFRYGTSTSTTNNVFNNVTLTSNSSTVTNIGNNTSQFEICGSAEDGYAVFDVTRVGTGSSVEAYYAGLSIFANRTQIIGGTAGNAFNYTGLRFKASAGNITGNIAVYGYAKA